MGPKEETPKVTIVIPAYNEEHEISNAILEMENQTYRDRIVLVVDDGSKDNTASIVQDLMKSFPDLNLLRISHGGPSRARNRGAADSKGEFLFFGECDCVYDPDYLELAVRKMQEYPEAGAVCLTGAPLVEKSTVATKSIELENKVQHKLLNEGKLKPFYAWVYRRKAFDEVGGFDERLFQAEDKDFFGRVVSAGFAVSWIPGIHWRHKRSENLRELIPKWYRRGRTRVIYSLKHRLLRELLRELGPFWILMVAIAMLAFLPTASIVLILLVLTLFALQVVKVFRITRSVQSAKEVYFAYLLFIISRNLSTAVGYSLGLLRYTWRSLRGRQITYANV